MNNSSTEEPFIYVLGPRKRRTISIAIWICLLFLFRCIWADIDIFFWTCSFLFCLPCYSLCQATHFSIFVYPWIFCLFCLWLSSDFWVFFFARTLFLFLSRHIHCSSNESRFIMLIYTRKFSSKLFGGLFRYILWLNK